MCLGLWRFACAVAKAQAMALAVAMPDDAQAMASSPKPWPWERRSWHQAPGKVPKPQAMAIASGHGSRPWPWLGPQAYGQRNVSMGIGCRVWGVGYWVVDIGYRVLVFGCFGFRYRVAVSLSNSNMLDARWVGRSPCHLITLSPYHLMNPHPKFDDVKTPHRVQGSP